MSLLTVLADISTQVQFGPQSEKDIHSAVPTERHTSDKMESTIISKCLELTKLVKDQNKCFEIKKKLECSHIRLTSEEKQSIKPCKKSPSQLKRHKERKQKFVDIKSKEEAPTTEMNAGKPSATEKAERNLIEGTKKVLNVSNSEKDVTSFLDNLLKPKVPVRTNNSTEVKTTMEKKSLSCYNCSFEGQNQQELKRHVELKHRRNAHSKIQSIKVTLITKISAEIKPTARNKAERIWLWWPASWVPLHTGEVPL